MGLATRISWLLVSCESDELWASCWKLNRQNKCTPFFSCGMNGEIRATNLKKINTKNKRFRCFFLNRCKVLNLKSLNLKLICLKTACIEWKQTNIGYRSFVILFLNRRYANWVHRLLWDIVYKSMWAENVKLQQIQEISARFLETKTNVQPKRLRSFFNMSQRII